MLDSLRRATGSIFGRAVMGTALAFIVFSFAVWGIGDIFRGFGSDSLAEVGGRTIGTQDFRTAYDRQINALQQQQQRRITAEEAQAQGLGAQVLSSLVADASLDAQAQRLGLAIGDKQVADSIVDDATLKGPDGKFDSNAFANLLQQNGLTEAQFVRQQRNLLLRRELADALLSNLPTPTPMQEAVDQFRNETRSIDTFALPASAAGHIADPSDKDLQSWFDARKLEWSAPEYRALVVLSVSPTDLADPSKIADADAQAYYDANKATFGAPEKRALLQATFSTRDAADSTAAAIKGGQDFAKAVAAGKGSLVDLGTVVRASIFDPAVAEAAFSVPQGRTSAPVAGRFGWVLVQANKILPGTLPPFEQMKSDIKSKLAAQKASGQVSALRDRIEDQRTAGKTLAEAAAVAGLPVKKIDAVDARGNGRDGKPVAAPDESDLLKAAFASDVGMDNDVLSTRDGGDVWFEVASVDPAHERTLKDVRPQVLAAWRQDETENRLADKAADIVRRIDGGAAFADVAGSFSAPVKTVSDVKRVGTTDVAPTIAAAAFQVPVHGAGSAAIDAQTRMIFQVVDSQTPAFDPSTQTSKAVADDLKQQMSDDILAEYLQALQSDLGVKINQAAVASVISGNSQTQQ
jgi:peptidyl-prolyl cis-trans isomerase D